MKNKSTGSFADIVYKAMHGKRRPVKKYVYIKKIYNRDANGRFTGGIKRKAHTRKIMDYTSWTTGMEMVAENISANNALLKRITKHD